MALSFSTSADRNKEAIGDALQYWLIDATKVLEIGSGTGQHAVYLSNRFPALHWWPTDRQENLTGIRQRVSESGLNNIAEAFEIDVGKHVCSPVDQFDLAYSANTAHIMHEIEVEKAFHVVGEWLTVDGIFALYGPFQYGGVHTADSNHRFDQMLRQQAPHMGVRDKHLVDNFAADAGLQCLDDIAMPSNNRLVLWRKRSS